MIDIALFSTYVPLLVQGIGNTLLISISSCMIGFIFGLILAMCEEYMGQVTKFFVQIYITIVRGTPMLIQILGAYYILPMIGIHCSGIMTAIIAIGLNSAAYISQVIKAGISSVSIIQIEAAYVLGFNRYQTARYIVLPQAVRVIFPALSNELVTLVKDSSLASTIGVMELTKQGRIIQSQTYDAISVFALLFGIYLLITSIISYIMYLIEKRMKLQC